MKVTDVEPLDLLKKSPRSLHPFISAPILDARCNASSCRMTYWVMMEGIADGAFVGSRRGASIAGSVPRLLLPKLLSGELSISEAMLQMEAVDA